MRKQNKLTSTKVIMANILIIDDDEMMCNMLSGLVRDMGHDAACAYTLMDGLKEVSAKTFDVVFLDVGMPDGNGLDILPKIRETSSSPEVIIITGAGNPDGAELAIKNGAWDYIEKPSSIEDMTLPLVRVLQYREEKKVLKSPVALKRDAIISSSPQMRVCLDLLAQAAGSNASVLITGETGTGKELFAWAIHDNSPRAKKNFVVVDCTALPETLVENVLFGHEKSAFTGADKANEGLIKQADDGTLFLDEVGELPISIQRAFLRVLQEHRFRPIGSKQEVTSNFRLVAATNKNLEKMVQRGTFRDDLLFRLRSLTIEIPPLREHPDDIKELVLYYTAKLRGSTSRNAKQRAKRDTIILEAYQDYLDLVELLLERAKESIKTLRIRGCPQVIRLMEIEGYIKQAERQIHQVRRRVLNGEYIPHDEKVFSIFEEYTEWICKGKAGVPQELGLRVCLLEDQYGFILYHKVMEKQTDDKVTVPMVKETKQRFPDLNSCSFDKNLYSPTNKKELEKILDKVILSRKGRLSLSEKEIEQTEEFIRARYQHAAVKSAINAVGNHGLDHCPDHGIKGFKRYVALSVLARNLQILGNIIQQKELTRFKRREKKYPLAA